jgi:hypothetical protein
VDYDTLIFLAGENQHCRSSLVLIAPSRDHPLLRAENDSESGRNVTTRRDDITHPTLFQLYKLKRVGQGEV